MRRFGKFTTAVLLTAVTAAWGLTSISAYKTFTREVLTSSDLNSSFSTVITGVNNLIAIHPGDSTLTTRGVFDSLDAYPGPNLNILRTVVFRDNQDSLVVPGRISGDTVKVDDQLWIGMSAPIVGWSGGTTAGTRLNFGSLVRADSLRTDSLTAQNATVRGVFSAGSTIAMSALRDTVGAIISDSASAGATVVDTTATIAIPFSAGTSAAPAIYKTGDTNTGIYFSGADAIDIVAGGARGLKVQKGATIDTTTVMSPVFSVPYTAIFGDKILMGNDDYIGLSSATRIRFADDTVDTVVIEGASNIYTSLANLSITGTAGQGGSDSYDVFMAAKPGSGGGTNTGIWFASWSTSAQVGFGVNYLGDLMPFGNKARDTGSAAGAWDDVWADDFQNVADWPHFDDRDDLALLRAIEDSTATHPLTGYRLVKDSTLPREILARWDKKGTHRRVRAVGDTIEVAHEVGDVQYAPDGAPFISLGPAISLTQGAVRQLSAKVDSLTAVTDSLGAEIRQRDVAFAALEARVAKLEGR
uniref:Uncharacterized protein n=1 Tax=viral metagenome TaxID=1070528 RepID=A0A6M3KA70_9ZZZZ